MSFISLMKDSLFSNSGFQFPSSNLFLFEILNSNTIISDSSLKSYQFINLLGIPSFMYNVRSPPFLFLSFRNILQPSAKNGEFGNESSILVSDNKQISASLRTRSLTFDNLFQIQLILRCPIITCSIRLVKRRAMQSFFFNN